MTIVVAILVLSVLVVVHEFGHYIAGKRAGIVVTDFAVGFGPKLVKWQRNGTEFSIRLLPLGGFCKFLGEDDDDASEGSFNNAPLWGRIKTVFSGPFFNILLAIVIATIMMLMYGNRATQIADVIEGSNAQQAGLQKGDVIISVNDKAVPFFGQAVMELQNAGDTGINMVVDRNGEKMSFTMDKTEIYDEQTKENRMLIGITSDVARQKLGFFESIWMGIRFMVFMLVELVTGLASLIGSLFTQAPVAGTVGGPLTVVDTISQATRAGFETLLMIAAMLSVNLGVVNLLPLPALDGGRLVFFVLEALRGKPISPDKEGMVHFIGFAALMVLMVVLTYNDITRLISGG